MYFKCALSCSTSSYRGLHDFTEWVIYQKQEEKPAQLRTEEIHVQVRTENHVTGEMAMTNQRLPVALNCIDVEFNCKDITPLLHRHRLSSSLLHRTFIIIALTTITFNHLSSQILRFTMKMLPLSL